MNHSSSLQRFGITWVKASLTMRGMSYRRLLCWPVPEVGKIGTSLQDTNLPLLALRPTIKPISWKCAKSQPRIL